MPFDVIKELERIGWNKNDAKVYVALVELGEANPQEIARHSETDRTRVYDALKRLMKKGYCAKQIQVGKRGGTYRAEKVERVFQIEIEEIETTLESSKMILDELKELEKESERTEFLDDIRGKNRIRDKMEIFIKEARERIYWLQSPDVFGPPIQRWAFSAIKNAKEANENLDIKVSLQINDTNRRAVKRLIREGIEVYKRDEPLLPLALLIVDSDQFIQLNISNFEPLPEYYLGIYGESVSVQQMTGMEYLFNHILKDHVLVTKDNFDES